MPTDPTPEKASRGGLRLGGFDNVKSGLLIGKTVTLVADGWRVGDYSGRQYAYAYAPDKTLVNAELIRRGLGLCQPARLPPKTRGVPDVGRSSSASEGRRVGKMRRAGMRFHAGHIIPQ